MIIAQNIQICRFYFFIFRKALEIIVTSLNFYYNERNTNKKDKKMAQTILTFGLGKETLRAVRETAQKTGIQVKEISRKDYNQKLGALAGIQGFSKENTTYKGPELPLEMMIFSGVDSAKMHAFLDDYKQTGAQPVPLKAIITPHNIFWTVETLFNELKKEYLHFNK